MPTMANKETTKKIGIKHFKREVIFANEKLIGLSIKKSAGETNDIKINELLYKCRVLLLTGLPC